MMIAECKAARRTAALALAATVVLAAGPVAARIWSPPHRSLVGEPVVAAAVAETRYVLLGETHTNPHHHRLQARMLRAAARSGRRPALVLEMVRIDQQPAIERWRRAGADPAAFGRAVSWTGRGWPDWALYRPIIEAAVELDLPIHAGAPAGATFRAVADGGLEALEARRREELGLDAPLPDPGRERLEEALVRAHCGVSGHAPIGRMLALQRLRDAVMAERLVRVDRGDGAVLIAGNGHVRRDHGVPHYLAGHPGGGRALALAFLAGPPPTPGEHEGVFDLVWSTPGEVPRADCRDAD